MQRSADGWHHCVWPEAAPGMRYRFDIGQGRVLPDPASRYNPLGVHGPSEVIDPLDHEWADGDWSGLPWHEATVYELHVGCFTPEGSFDAAAQRLPYLRSLGIRAIELMPLAAFAGRRGWGYDGVLPFAVHGAYGTPRQLKRFVDAAHRHGLMVLLDVVYNHFGPDGNYLHACCPEFHDRTRSTPWGPALNFDGEQARQCAASSSTTRCTGSTNTASTACAWTPCMPSTTARRRTWSRTSPPPCATARGDSGRCTWCWRTTTTRRAGWRVTRSGRPRVATAQWNDDWHHAAHVLATGEHEGYYRDHAAAPLAGLARGAGRGLRLPGSAERPSRRACRAANRARTCRRQAFVDFLQNHDQIGNRAFGERLDALADPRAHRGAAGLPAAGAAGADAVHGRGVRGQLALPVLLRFRAAIWPTRCAAAGARSSPPGRPSPRPPRANAFPIPNAAATFAASRLRWADADSEAGRPPPGAGAAPAGAAPPASAAASAAAAPGRQPAQCDDCGFQVEWPLGDALRWTLRARFGGSIDRWPLRRTRARSIASCAAGAGTPADQVLVTLRQRVAA